MKYPDLIEHIPQINMNPGIIRPGVTDRRREKSSKGCCTVLLDEWYLHISDLCIKSFPPVSSKPLFIYYRLFFLFSARRRLLSCLCRDEFIYALHFVSLQCITYTVSGLLSGSSFPLSNMYITNDVPDWMFTTWLQDGFDSENDFFRMMLINSRKAEEVKGVKTEHGFGFILEQILNLDTQRKCSEARSMKISSKPKDKKRGLGDHCPYCSRPGHDEEKCYNKHPERASQDFRVRM